MADFTRSVVWRFWVALLLLGDKLLHLVRAATLEDRSEYQACVTNPSSCTSLMVPYADLSGTLPIEFGLLTAMSYIDMGGNNLEGSIPTELGLLTALTFFDVHENNLQGTIPTEVGRWTAMTRFRVSSNNLQGTIPSEVGLMTAITWFSVHSNAGLCGPLVSVGSDGTSYTRGIDGTNLGTDCQAPTQTPTQTPTRDPAAYVGTPCCDDPQAWRDAYDARLAVQ